MKAAGPAATLTLSPSFSMDGYDGSPIFDSKAVTIEGQGATFDAAGNGSFFFVLAGVSLTVRNVTLKNVRWIRMLSPAAFYCCTHRCFLLLLHSPLLLLQAFSRVTGT